VVFEFSCLFYGFGVCFFFSGGFKGILRSIDVFIGELLLSLPAVGSGGPGARVCGL